MNSLVEEKASLLLDSGLFVKGYVKHWKHLSYDNISTEAASASHLSD